MKTAEEFLKMDESGVYNVVDITQAMIGFARMHCEAQGKAICENAEIITEPDYRGGEWNIISEDSIINAYPLINIK